MRGTSRHLTHGPAARIPLVILGLAPGRSAHSAAEHACLARHAYGMKTIVELGVEQGVGTTVLKEAMAPTGRLYAVDPHPVGRLGVSFPRLIARMQVSRARGARVHWLRMTESAAATVLAEQEPEGVELIFSDCVFDYTSLDFLWSSWRPRVKPGGIFIQSTSQPVGTRTTPEHETVIFTRDVLVRDPDFEVAEVAGTFTVLRRLMRQGA